MKLFRTKRAKKDETPYEIHMEKLKMAIKNLGKAHWFIKEYGMEDGSDWYIRFENEIDGQIIHFEMQDQAATSDAFIFFEHGDKMDVPGITVDEALLFTEFTNIGAKIDDLRGLAQKLENIT